MQNVVNNKKQLIDVISINQDAILKYGIKKLGIFGSFVRDEVRPDSDVDFFVEFDPSKKTFKNFMALAFLLEDLTGRKVELVTPQSLSKYIGPYILKEVEYVPFAA
jgi:predicted nucleotidyltransferase